MRILLVSSTLLLALASNGQFVLITPAGTGGRTSSVARPPALLHDGNVLIVNGYGGAELYDSRFRTFVSTGSPPVRLQYGGFAVVGLPDGRAAITGAYDPDTGARDYILLWDRTSGVFRQITGMKSPRTGHAAVTLDSDVLLIVGGDGPAATWETYDLRQEKSIASGFLPEAALFGAQAFMHPSGKIVFLGGGRAMIFDPATSQFSAGFGMPPGSPGSTAVEMLADGRFLVTGGTREGGPALVGLDSAFIFNPFTGAQELVGRMLNARFWHAATRLPSGKVLVTGGSAYCLGSCKPAHAPAELFDPVTKSFSSVGSMNAPRLNHRPVRLPSGEILIVGGETGTDYLPDPELYIGERIARRRRAVSH